MCFFHFNFFLGALTTTVTAKLKLVPHSIVYNMKWFVPREIQAPLRKLHNKIRDSIVNGERDEADGLFWLDILYYFFLSSVSSTVSFSNIRLGGSRLDIITSLFLSHLFGFTLLCFSNGFCCVFSIWTFRAAGYCPSSNSYVRFRRLPVCRFSFYFFDPSPDKITQAGGRFPKIEIQRRSTKKLWRKYHAAGISKLPKAKCEFRIFNKNI